MHLTCPACDAGYEVPDARLGEGRRVRCVQCGQVWTVAMPAPPPPPAPDPEPEPPAAPAPAPEPAFPPQPATAVPLHGSAMEQLRARPAELPRSGRFALAGWLATAVILAGAGWAAVTYREPIMRAWPASTRAYAALGLLGGPPH